MWSPTLPVWKFDHAKSAWPFLFLGQQNIDLPIDNMEAMVMASTEQLYFSEATIIFDDRGSNGNSTILLPVLVNCPQLLSAPRP